MIAKQPYLSKVKSVLNKKIPSFNPTIVFDTTNKICNLVLYGYGFSPKLCMFVDLKTPQRLDVPQCTTEQKMLDY